MALLYLKYTDDKFIIWKGTEGQLIAFVNESNETRYNFKFEYEISSQKTLFLDVR